MNRWPTLPVQPKTAQFFFWGAILCIRFLNSPRRILNSSVLRWHRWKIEDESQCRRCSFLTSSNLTRCLAQSLSNMAETYLDLSHGWWSTWKTIKQSPNVVRGWSWDSKPDWFAEAGERFSPTPSHVKRGSNRPHHVISSTSSALHTNFFHLHALYCFTSSLSLVQFIMSFVMIPRCSIYVLLVSSRRYMYQRHAEHGHRRPPWRAKCQPNHPLYPCFSGHISFTWAEKDVSSHCDAHVDGVLKGLS